MTKAWGWLATASLALTGPAWAADEARTLDTIVVTARKKSEPLQKVPQSVVALDHEELLERGVDNLADLAAAVPGLQQQDLAITSRLTLRGVNSGDNNAFEQSVGVYLDGLYRGRMNQQHFGLFDLERVEVLKGPQVALYGNSSIGGAISAVTRKPGAVPGGETHAQWETQYREGRIEAGFDAPVSETLAFRVAGKWRDQHEGISPNAFSGGTEPRTSENAARVSMSWLPGEAWSVALRHERGDVRRDGHLFDVYKHVDGFGDPWPGSTFTGLDDGRLDVGNGAPFLYREPFLESGMTETMLDVRYRFDTLELASVSGWSDYGYRQALDVDITPATLVGVFQDEDYRQFSQELRLSGPATDRADFIAGLYYQSDTLRNDYLSDFNLPELLAPAFGVPASTLAPLVLPFSRHILIDQDTRQWAAFGSLDVQLAPRLAGSIGFRWMRIDKDARQAVRPAGIDHVDGPGPLVDVRWLDPQLAPLLLGNPDYLADPTGYVLVLADGTAIAPVLAPNHVVGYAIVSAGTGDLHEFADLSRRESHPMFNASLAWQWSDDLLLYATWANGAKAGGFDFLYEGDSRDEVEYDPEQANVFEVGVKKDWADARLNVALFHGRYSDLQVSVFDGGIGFVVGNAASSVSQGVDVDFVWNLSDAWRLSGAIAWLDFRYDEFRNANCSTTERLLTGAAICDWSGDTAPLVPETEATLALEHTARVGRWHLRNELRWSWKDDHATASDNEPQTRQPAYHLLDWRLALAPETGGWDVAFVGRNLTDERYLVFTSVIPLAPGGAFASVRSKGRELALEWNWRF